MVQNKKTTNRNSFSKKTKPSNNTNKQKYQQFKTTKSKNFFDKLEILKKRCTSQPNNEIVQFHSYIIREYAPKKTKFKQLN
jgi:hypothetical protein